MIEPQTVIFSPADPGALKEMYSSPIFLTSEFVISAYFIMELSVRIFRASLLMYGKKPTIQELIKYVRQG